MTSSSANRHSEFISGEIDREVRRIVDECYTKATEIIEQNVDVLHRSAALLMEKEKITGEEFAALFTPADANASKESEVPAQSDATVQA